MMSWKEGRMKNFCFKALSLVVKNNREQIETYIRIDILTTFLVC